MVEYDDDDDDGCAMVVIVIVGRHGRTTRAMAKHVLRKEEDRFDAIVMLLLLIDMDVVSNDTITQALQNK